MSDENNTENSPENSPVSEQPIPNPSIYIDGLIKRFEAASKAAEINPLAVGNPDIINDFYQIASGPGAIVESQPEWAGEGGILSNGFPTGIVLQEQYNKAWRQATAWIRVLGWHASQLTGQDVHDDGNVEKLWRQLYESFLVTNFFVTIDGPNNYTTLNYSNLTWTSPPVVGTRISLWIIFYGNTSSTCTLNFMGTGVYPILHENGDLPRPGDIAGPVNLIFSGPGFGGPSFWYIESISMSMLKPRLDEIAAAAGAVLTLTGAVTGSGITNINTALADLAPNPAGIFQSVTVNQKGLVTSGEHLQVQLIGHVSGVGNLGMNVNTTLSAVNVNPGTFQGIHADVYGRVINAVNMDYVLNSNLIPQIKYYSFGTIVDQLSSAGVYNYTVPAGCYLIQVFVIGGGGGSAGSSGPGVPQGATAGAGGGGCCISPPIAVTPGQVIGYIVGLGGAAVGYGSTGGNGGMSSFAGAYLASGGTGSSFAETGSAGNGVGGMFNLSGSPGTSYGTGAPNSAGGTGGTGGGPYGGGGGPTGTGTAGPGGFPGGGAGGPGSGGTMPGQPGSVGCIFVMR